MTVWLVLLKPALTAMIAATLFWVDATVRIREIKTVTQEKAYWMLPTGVKKIAYSQLSDIDFTSAKSKKVLLDKHINNEKVKTVQFQLLPQMNWTAFLKNFQWLVVNRLFYR